MEIETRTRTVLVTVEKVITEYRCLHCGEWFEPLRTDTKWCSHACRMKAYYRRKNAGKMTKDKAMGLYV